MTTSTVAAVQLALAASADTSSQSAPWIGPLVALGSRVARYSRKMGKRQLVIAVSVPRRDYAAVLIGCGWVLASEAPVIPAPLEVLRVMEPGQSLRAVNNEQVISGTFVSLEESEQPSRARFAGSTWIVDSIRAISPIAEIEGPRRSPRPDLGSVQYMAGLDLTWDERLAQPAADLAIIGTESWLKQELEANLGIQNDDKPPSSIRSILMPEEANSATWYTRFFPAASFMDKLPLPTEVNATVLDGNGAAAYLTEIEVPVVICVLDRSIADEATAETIVQLRNTRGEPVSLANDLQWSPPTGVEALGFTVAL